MSCFLVASSSYAFSLSAMSRYCPSFLLCLWRPPHISLSLKELETFRCEERLILKATGRNRTSIVAKATPRRALRRLVACWKGGTPPFSMVSLGWVRRGPGVLGGWCTAMWGSDSINRAGKKYLNAKQANAWPPTQRVQLRWLHLAIILSQQQNRLFNSIIIIVAFNARTSSARQPTMAAVTR